MSDNARPVLVIGESGQLATCLRRVAADAVCLGRTAVDVTALDQVSQILAAHRPRAVINAAAYTGVDKAETDRDAAMLLNGHAPGVLATACASAGIPFVHISSDYVFNGETGAPYPEDFPTDPVNFYGLTKQRGEEAALGAGGRVAVIRTSWVFSDVGANFVKTMLRLAGDRDEIGVVSDQAGCPTSAADLARACLAMTAWLQERESASAVFHFANAGETTWAEFAEAVMEEARLRDQKAARIRPITTSEYPTPARRPRDSRLATGRIASLLKSPPQHWRTALSEVCERLLAPAGASGG